ncbi:MAG: DUF4184 family protein, partial [Actinomycetota bacterium]|nr:DUF4184 family protein [Actinomycetota bacterium]
MPFTASHIAAALPFRRTPLIPAAVVIGTMSPDIPYYVPLSVPRELSHSLLGLVTIDLALALLGVLAWWMLLREPVVDVLPRWIGTRIPAVGRAEWRPSGWGWASTLGVLVLSALVGGLTHLLWDSFTHPGWLVDHVAVLRQQLGPLPLEKWLQHLSSVTGLAIVGVWSFRHLRRADSDPARSSRFSLLSRAAAWAVIVVAGVGGALVV